MRAVALNLLYAIASKPAALASVILRIVVVLLCWRGGPWVALLAALLLFSESFAGLLLKRNEGR